ncbi:hypothetical protein EOD41_08530 [Mucilaginibacter limnophilus]|uniref:Type II toxin-antitoxin system RelE/ParE family toxin n=1 Tax=Mucilaginibacter limnophilus TaxID=1932778 RepID=A0A3S2V9H7_9SPHI|nr:hypothetical protein EOD41_08530 [Mucilaginibacter limnophilus]
MAFDVIWSAEAEKSYSKILLYLQKNWTDREVNHFVKRVNILIKNITQQPYLFKPSSTKQIRKAVIGKQNSLFYLVRNHQIILLTFWDNRQHPKKNKY